MAFEIAPQEFSPCFSTREVEGKSYTIVDERCSGFLQGIRLTHPVSKGKETLIGFEHGRPSKRGEKRKRTWYLSPLFDRSQAVGEVCFPFRRHNVSNLYWGS